FYYIKIQDSDYDVEQQRNKMPAGRAQSCDFVTEHQKQAEDRAIIKTVEFVSGKFRSERCPEIMSKDSCDCSRVPMSKGMIVTNLRQIIVNEIAGNGACKSDQCQQDQHRNNNAGGCKIEVYLCPGKFWLARLRACFIHCQSRTGAGRNRLECIDRVWHTDSPFQCGAIIKNATG